MRLSTSLHAPLNLDTTYESQRDIAWRSATVLFLVVFGYLAYYTKTAEGIIGPAAWPWVFISLVAFLMAGVTGLNGLRDPSRLLGMAARAAALMVVVRSLFDASDHSVPSKLLAQSFNAVGALTWLFGEAMAFVGMFVLIFIVIAAAALYFFPLLRSMIRAFGTATFGNGWHARFWRIGLLPLIGSMVGSIVVLVARAALMIGQWVFYGLVVFGSGADIPVSAGGFHVEKTQTADRAANSRTGQAPSGQRSFAGFFNALANVFRRRDNLTDEGQPIYSDDKSGQVAAAWSEKLIGPDGKPAREAVLRTLDFKPRVNDAANRQLVLIGSALLASIITDALRHGNSGGGRMGGDEEGTPTAPAPVGTRAYIKLAMVRGIGPGEDIPATGAKLGWVIDVSPSITNNILTRISPENLAENIARLTQYSPAQVRDRLIVHDEALQDDPAFGSVAGIYITFRLGSAPAAPSSAEDRPEDGLPW